MCADQRERSTPATKRPYTTGHFELMIDGDVSTAYLKSVEGGYIKGMPVEEAAAVLRFMPQYAAKDIARVLQSATANAENNHNLSAEDLIVLEAVADEGPTIKRFRPRAQGRAFPIHKPMTHITIVVADQEA